MTKAIWSGNLGFGLVNINVKLYKARDSTEVGFHMLHQDCQQRVNYQVYCPTCRRIISRSELVKGYEYRKGQYVALTEADLANLPLATTKQIEILGFIKESVDPRIIEDSFYVAPEKGRDKGVSRDEIAFQLLVETMKRLGVKAIGKLSIREREHLVLLQPFNGILLLQTLCWADEVRSYDELKPAEVSLGERELALAEKLVNQMTMVFDHSAYQDEYQLALERLISAKLEGRELEKVEEVRSTEDLVSQLLASIGLK